MLHSIRCPIFFSPHGQKHAASQFDDGKDYDATQGKPSVFALEEDKEK